MNKRAFELEYLTSIGINVIGSTLQAEKDCLEVIPQYQ
jgi:hypothetical protein